MGLGRLHFPQVGLQPLDGEPGGPFLQLVEPLRALLRRGAPPGSSSQLWPAARCLCRAWAEVQSGGQRTVKVSILHEKQDCIARAVTQISKELQQIRSITEQWNSTQCWTLLLTRLFRRWLGGKWFPGLPSEAELVLSGWGWPQNPAKTARSRCGQLQRQTSVPIFLLRIIKEFHISLASSFGGVHQLL